MATLLALSMPIDSSAQNASAGAVTPAQSAAIDAIFSRYAHSDSPGCAVGVTHNGFPILSRAYGQAHLEQGVAATPDSIYEAGSDSKQFTAAAIVMLAHDGKLSLDDDVRRHLPELPDYGRPITLRQLVTHTSGLRDWGSVASLAGWPRNSRTTNNDDVLQIVARQRALNFTPGAHHLYSNSNYNLLAIVVQRVSGETLADFTQRRIFTPLGMRDTSWRANHQTVVARRTGAYEREGGVYVNDQVIEDAYGNGGLLTTVGDMMLWQRALETSHFWPGFTTAMEARGRLNDGTVIAYAMGVMVLNHRGEREVSHSGSTGGYRAWLARYPDQKLSVSLLCNAGDADPVTTGRSVADVFLNGPIPAAYHPRGRVPTGLYLDPVSLFPVRLTTDGGSGLMANGRTLAAIGPNRWQWGADTLFLGRNGTLMREAREGERRTYQAIANAGAIDAAAYVGRFCSPDTQSCIAIETNAQGQVTLRGPRWPATVLTPSYTDAFLATVNAGGGPITVRFHRTPTGGMRAVSLGETRATDVVFDAAPAATAL